MHNLAKDIVTVKAKILRIRNNDRTLVFPNSISISIKQVRSSIEKIFSLKWYHWNSFVTFLLRSQKSLYQHLVWPPFAFNMALTLPDMLSIKFWHTEARIFDHSFPALFQSSSSPLGFSLYSTCLPLRWSHEYSMDSRSNNCRPFHISIIWP